MQIGGISDDARIGSRPMMVGARSPRELYEDVRIRIETAARAAGRRGDEITLVGVSKNVAADAVRAAVAAGVRHVGENRVQELLAKQEALEDLDVTWHMVGHLQTNKINKVLGRIRVLQSLDRLELAEALQKRLHEPLECLVEVRIAEGESTKHGVLPGDLPDLLDALPRYDRIQVRGLMTIGPLTEDRGTIRAAFRRMARLYENEARARRPRQEFRWLSMGMSGDFEIAIEEGSTMVRLGRALFGARSL